MDFTSCIQIPLISRSPCLLPLPLQPRLLRQNLKKDHQKANRPTKQEEEEEEEEKEEEEKKEEEEEEEEEKKEEEEKEEEKEEEDTDFLAEAVMWPGESHNRPLISYIFT